MTFDEKITELEAKELKRFSERRRAFGGVLEIMNVHNVPALFPNIYKALYGEKLPVGLFGGPYYGDYNKQKAVLFEKYLDNPKMVIFASL